jgi:hypothetical protein
LAGEAREHGDRLGIALVQVVDEQRERLALADPHEHRAQRGLHG